jgi:hypothetical protein
MPTFNFTGPDGKSYSVEGPEGSTPEQAFQVLQRQLASAPQESAPKPDKYQQAALEERDALKAKGIDTGAGFTRRLVQGYVPFADEAVAALTTPLEMAKRGTLSPREGYNYTKAREDLIMDDSRKGGGWLGEALTKNLGTSVPTSVLGAITEVGGGVAQGLNVARAGLSFGRNLASNAGLGRRSLAAAGDSAAFGALYGAGEGDSLGERVGNALVGAGTGFAVGGATPGAVALGGQLASPIISNIRARTNPEGFARSQAARVQLESGQTPAQTVGAVTQAAREGQGMFTYADALGNAGQRMLSTTTRAPGRARTDVTEFLDQRQAGQGRRISNTLAEGFDSPQTAAQTEARLTAQRTTDANAAYDQVRSGASQVDLVGPINHLDSIIGTQPGQVTRPANDSIEAILLPFRNRLANVNPDDFAAVQRIRGDMADAAQSAMQGGYGNRSRLIGQAVRQLDTAMESASNGFRRANANFAQASRDIEAVGQGRDAAMRGRTEDIIPQFQGLQPRGQQAFRAGYADPLIQQTQGAAFGANKARPLINDAFRDEAAAMAPGNALMQRRIGREDTMFQTRHAAVGNSKTAENLADDSAMGIDPTLVGQVLSGNWSGALRSALGAGQNLLSGNTPQVREAVANILLQRGQNMNPAALQRMLDEAVHRIDLVRQIAQQLGRGGSAGLAVAPSASGQRK